MTTKLITKLSILSSTPIDLKKKNLFRQLKMMEQILFFFTLSINNRFEVKLLTNFNVAYVFENMKG